jgi:hypothetical protein
MMVDAVARRWMRALPVLASACAVLFATMGAFLMERLATLSVAHPLHTHFLSMVWSQLSQDVPFPDRLR